MTLCRTGVDYDYRGDVIDAHAPEMPTRFAKQLVASLRGGVAVGHGPRGGAAAGASLCPGLDAAAPARHPRRRAAHPGARTQDVRQRLDKPCTPWTANCRRCTCSACSTAMKSKTPAAAIQLVLHLVARINAQRFVFQICYHTIHTHTEKRVVCVHISGTRIEPNDSAPVAEADKAGKVPFVNLDRDETWAAADARYRKGWK